VAVIGPTPYWVRNAGAAALPVGERTDLAVQPAQLDVEGVHHPQRHHDGLPADR